jgi:glycosyltransferase involved in cell wall biosynthesis
VRIVVIHSNPDYLVGLRLPLLRHLAGYGDVVAMAPRLEARHRRVLDGIGVRGASIRLSPTGMNPFADALDTMRLARRLGRLQPDIVITNTVKPVIYGTLAARAAGVPHRYALVSGLGYAFTDAGRRAGLRKKVIRAVAGNLYRLAFMLEERVIFQNRDDMDEVVAAGICPADRAAAWVGGSGVDVDAYPLSEEPTRPTFIMVARLLVEKGVRDYLEAARITRGRLPEARFLLVGDVDGNPSAIDRQELEPYVNDGTIEWPGAVGDVRPWLAKASVFVLPSYREGLPRSTLEAMATGLAVITTDVPGCRETVVEGENGRLVPVRDPEALAAAMEQLASDPRAVDRMRQASRRLAESRFDVSIVHRQLDELLGLVPGAGS